MKIAKLKCDKLEQTPADVARKSFIRMGSKMVALHNSVETATGYLIVVHQQFKDETAPMLIIGDLTSTWVKYAKSLKASSPTNVLYGQCFAQMDANGSITIQLLNKAGKAKLNPFKQLFKTTLHKAKTNLVWANGLSDEAEETAASETELLGDVLETMDDKDEQRIEEFMSGTPVNETMENLAEDAAHIKRRIDEMATAAGAVKQKIFDELQALVTQFIHEADAIEGALPPKLAKFYTDLQTLSQKWTKQVLRQQIRKSGLRIVEKFKLLKSLSQ